MGLANIPIQGFQIEFQLSEVFRFETADLQFKGDQAIQATVKEQEIKRKISSADLDGIFGTNETEVLPPVRSESP